MPDRVYWDSSVFIDWLDRNGPSEKPDRVRRIAPLVERAVRGEIVILTSAMAIAEVVYCHGAPSPDGGDDALIQRFFKEAYIEVRAASSAIAGRARQLSRETSLQPADAIHLATAISFEVPKLYTFDGNDLIPLSDKYGNPRIKICEPEEPADPDRGQMNLFSALGKEVEEAVHEEQRKRAVYISGTTSLPGDGTETNPSTDGGSKKAEAAEGEAGPKA